MGFLSPAPEPRLGSEADSFRCRPLDGPGGSAAKTVRPVHVLHIGLWMYVTSGRDRAHHIGDGEHRRIVALALEGRAEAVIAELRVHRLLRIRDPGEGAGIAG